jgi:hypothetical protein
MPHHVRTMRMAQAPALQPHLYACQPTLISMYHCPAAHLAQAKRLLSQNCLVHLTADNSTQHPHWPQTHMLQMHIHSANTLLIPKPQCFPQHRSHTHDCHMVRQATHWCTLFIINLHPSVKQVQLSIQMVSSPAESQQQQQQRVRPSS